MLPETLLVDVAEGERTVDGCLHCKLVMIQSTNCAISSVQNSSARTSYMAGSCASLFFLLIIRASVQESPPLDISPATWTKWVYPLYPRVEDVAETQDVNKLWVNLETSVNHLAELEELCFVYCHFWNVLKKNFFFFHGSKHHLKTQRGGWSLRLWCSQVNQHVWFSGMDRCWEQRGSSDVWGEQIGNSES